MILAYDDSGHIQKEEINEAKIETTNRVLKKISEADPHQLKLEVSEPRIIVIVECEHSFAVMHFNPLSSARDLCK